MKKYAWMLCVCVLLGLLAGCQTDIKDPTQTTAGEQTADIRPLPPENPGSSLIDYDPNRQIYIGTENIYMDYYFGITSAPYLDIPVYSKASLGRDDYGGLGHFITKLCWDPGIELDIMQCWVEVTQVELPGKTEFMAGKEDDPESVMPYYVYQAYRGGNVSALANAKIGYKPDSSMTDPLRADFEALTKADLPEFYVYNLRVHFLDIPEPEPGEVLTLKKLELTVNGQTYESEFGRVRFFNREDCPDPKPIRMIPEQADAYTGSFSELYSDGVVKVLRIPVIHELDPEMEYAWICDAWAIDEGSEVLAVYVTIKDQYGEYRTFAVNDPRINDTDFGVSIVVRPGEIAYVDVVVKNSYTDRLLSNIHFQIVLYWGASLGSEIIDEEKSVANTAFFCKAYTVVSNTNTNHYENYAIIFDGVNMEPYYDYYFATYPEWHKDHLR